MSNPPAVPAPQPSTKITEIHIGCPDEYDGNVETAQAWLDSVRLYLLINQALYHNNNRKIAYALSYMKKGSTAMWAEVHHQQGWQYSYLNKSQLVSCQKLPSTEFWKHSSEDGSATFLHPSKTELAHYQSLLLILPALFQDSEASEASGRAVTLPFWLLTFDPFYSQALLHTFFRVHRHILQMT